MNSSQKEKFFQFPKRKLFIQVDDCKMNNDNNINDIKNIKTYNDYYFRLNLRTNNFKDKNNIEIENEYNEYTKNNIPIDKDAFIPSLFNQLNKTDDFSCLDFIIKNQNILVDKNLGLYLIDRSRSMVDQKNKDLAFNLGIEMIMMDEENISDVLFELIEEDKINECVDIVIDLYIGYKFDKKDKNIKGDSFKHLKRFIANTFTNINKNKNRYMSLGEEDEF